ncbi:MAG: type II toxin-antitoxin system VapC family toxin [candidate division KSB1 bacterium]|nr:type II toxin-antitoxin system VapC family toxin [candidate division KSB1 bacterium]
MSEKKGVLIDTNIVIRFLTGDDEKLYKQAEKIMADLEQNAIKAMMLEPVLAECVYILKGVYGVERAMIAMLLRKILSLKVLKIPNKPIYFKALDYFESQNLDFVDCLLLAFSQHKAGELLSFDKKLLSPLSSK